MSLISLLNDNPRDILCGGRHNQMIDTSILFFERLRSIGTKLVFFCEGPVQEEKSTRWMNVQNELYRKRNRFYDAVYEEKSIDYIVDKFNCGKITTIKSSLLQVAARYGIVKMVMDQQVDAQIASYANNTNAMAIIANGTNFLIFNGSWKYWSAGDLQLEHATTMEYCRPALCAHLGLMKNQMPLLATLCGNDFLMYNDLHKFLNRFKSDDQWKFEQVAKFILAAFQRPPHEFDKEDYNLIAVRCFGVDYKFYLPIIKRCIAFYILRLPRKLPPLLDSLQLQVLHSISDESIYCILADVPQSLNVNCTDLRRTDFYPYIHVALKLMRRQMGILLQYQRNSKVRRRVRAKRVWWEECLEFVCEPEYPPCK